MTRLAPPPLADVYTCADGTDFIVLSELIRGEPRWYWVIERDTDLRERKRHDLDGSHSRVKMQRLARRLAMERGL